MTKTLALLVSSFTFFGCFTAVDRKDEKVPEKTLTGVVYINQSLKMSKQGLIDVLEDLKWNWETHLSGNRISPNEFKKLDYTMDIFQSETLLLKRTSIVYQNGAVTSRKYLEMSLIGKKEGEAPDTLNRCSENIDEIGKKEGCGYHIFEYGAVLDSAVNKIKETDSNWFVGITTGNFLSQFLSVNNPSEKSSFNLLDLEIKN